MKIKMIMRLISVLYFNFSFTSICFILFISTKTISGNYTTNNDNYCNYKSIITPVDIDPEDLLPPLIYDDIFVLSVISG